MKKEGVVLGIAILFIISFFFDRQIISAIQSLRNPASDTFFLWLLFLEKGIIFYPLIVGLTIIFLLWKKRNIIPFISGFVISLALVFLLKNTISRERPFPNSGDSFPSGHAAATFTPLPFLEYKIFKIITIVGTIMACLFAFTRLWFGLHYLSDVVVGSIIGYVIAFVIKNNWKKLKISKPKKEKRGKEKWLMNLLLLLI